ncbi:unnamed protein product, partial [Prorocentrum cordatum]
ELGSVENDARSRPFCVSDAADGVDDEGDPLRRGEPVFSAPKKCNKRVRARPQKLCSDDESVPWKKVLAPAAATLGADVSVERAGREHGRKGNGSSAGSGWLTEGLDSVQVPSLFGGVRVAASEAGRGFAGLPMQGGAHPVFSISWGPDFKPLRSQVKILFGLVPGSKNWQKRQPWGDIGRSISSMPKKTGACRGWLVISREQRVRFKNSSKSQWHDVGADEVDIGKDAIPVYTMKLE